MSLITGALGPDTGPDRSSAVTLGDTVPMSDVESTHAERGDRDRLVRYDLRSELEALAGLWRERLGA